MVPETRPSKVGKWTEPARRVLRERYLSRKDGEVTETPEEMCWRVATSIAAEGLFRRSSRRSPRKTSSLFVSPGSAQQGHSVCTI